MWKAGDFGAGLLAIGFMVWSSSAPCQTPSPADSDVHQVFAVWMGAGKVRMDLVSAMDRMDGADAGKSALPLRTCMHRLEFEASEIERLEQTVWEYMGIRDHMKEPADREYMVATIRKSSAQISGLLKASKTIDFERTYQKCTSFHDFQESASRVSELYDQAQELLAQLQAPAL